MIWRSKQTEYNELILNALKDQSITDKEAVQSTSYLNNHLACRNITFQVTEDCNCACTYCYQGNKTKHYMSVETGKQIVDCLFNEWYTHPTSGLINQADTAGIILDFIGGEPLLNIKVISEICDYFWKRCLAENHPWKDYWAASLSSNGALYFDPEVQKFFHKFKEHISYGVTVDGPQEIHDACRVYKDGSGGNWKDAYAALLDQKKNQITDPGTKVTISADNMKYLNTIVKFFFDNEVYYINANVVFEHEWTIEESKEFYIQLKALADTLLFDYDDSVSGYVGLFVENFFRPMSTTIAEENRNWCGGTGSMLAFDPSGIAYPCLRYMPTSLGKDQPPLIIGNCTDGIFKTDEAAQLKSELDSITRRSQSNDECYYCPIANGCAWCSGWNYQENGTPNKRSTRICNSHKARSLANAYFWNNYYKQHNIPKYFHRYLSDEEALKFISKEELTLLDSLENPEYELVNRLPE